jgi:hypothetical protein
VCARLVRACNMSGVGVGDTCKCKFRPCVQRAHALMWVIMWGPRNKYRHATTTPIYSPLVYTGAAQELLRGCSVMGKEARVGKNRPVLRSPFARFGSYLQSQAPPLPRRPSPSWRPRSPEASPRPPRRSSGCAGPAIRRRRQLRR